MPKLAANLSMMFNEVDFLDRFGAAAKAGFKAVEYLFPYAYPKEQIAERLAAHGLGQVLFNLPPGNWEAGERGLAIMPDRIGEFQDGVGRAIDYAKALGCRRIHAMAGVAPAKMHPARLRETYVSNLKFAAAEAAKAGLTLVIEPINTRDIPGYYLCTSTQALAIIGAVGAANLKLQYDIYHAQIMEGDLAHTFEKNLAMIGHVQIADTPGRHEPGTGEINYNFLLGFMDKLGYQGWIGCEYRPLGDTVAGLAWAKPYLAAR
ncbi:MAG TPA: 2-oxo-tetronate isomerase [Alphaproteobacteria bacterium]|nr:2-oxo-tetronate isomerase [Alphaproteobacteria bacterium]